VNTTHAKLGDAGSVVLPEMDSQATWTAGEAVEVSWTIEANHGGGYSYRLAPIESPLTEVCVRLSVQTTPLVLRARLYHVANHQYCALPLRPIAGGLPTDSARLCGAADAAVGWSERHIHLVQRNLRD
jgi:hypothetical protein